MKKRNELSIFIVEDNEIFRKTLKLDIENSFANLPVTLNINTFGTGEACMDRFIREMPELVILDYQLNNKHAEAANGISVLQWIKKENPETQVIMLTSEDHIDIVVKSLQYGACDYVVKSETQFKKINYSIRNAIVVLDAKAESRKFMNIAIALVVGFVLMLIGVFIKNVYFPTIIH
jgi:DNA-binding NarL/FixJ family response regulator